MDQFSGMGKVLMVLGLLLLGVGALLWLGGKFWGIGRLPGDIFYKKGNFTFYFPIVTCIIISLVLSLLLSLFGRK
ncbi:MAG: DUF2905 domain-containing protein [Bacillota bacterium]